MKRFLFLIVAAIKSFSCLSQDSIQSSKKLKFIFNGYADLYYQFSNEASERPSFIYNFKENHSLSTNMVLLKTSLSYKKWNTSIGIFTGDYAHNNLASEPRFFQHIYEANIKYTLSSKAEFQAGIFPSHIGLESAISSENWNLGRSILAENTPYYETGLKFNFEVSEKTKLSLLLINGWQHIKDDNHQLSLGTQAQITLSPQTSLNSSTYFGKEGPDSASHFRAFHNFYLTYKRDKKNSLALLLDMGIQQKVNTNYSGFWGTAILYQHNFCPDISACARIEFYNDKNGVIIFSPPGGLNLLSYSFNVDYYNFKYFSWRLESRFMRASHPIFENSSSGSRQNFSLLLCLSLHF